MLIIKNRSRFGRAASNSAGSASRFSAVCCKEFVVDFGGSGKSVRQINDALLAKGIFGGKDLSQDFPELGPCALYAITEQITQKDIDTLVAALRTITA